MKTHTKAAHKTVTVPLSHPAHPKHSVWAELLKAIEAAVIVGPAVVAIVDPGDAKLAGDLGNIAGAVLVKVEAPAA